MYDYALIVCNTTILERPTYSIGSFTSIIQYSPSDHRDYGWRIISAYKTAWTLTTPVDK